MANYRAVANGNWSSGATWGGGAIPPNGEGHNIYSNTFTVTIDTNVDVALITNAAITASFVGGGTSAASGGGFTINGGITVTATCTTTGTTAGHLLTFSANLPDTANIVGNVTGGNTSNAIGARNTGTGTLNITGNCNSPGNSTNTAVNSSTGVINIIGNCTGGTGGSGVCVVNSVGGVINITGSVTGGSAGNTFGVTNAGTGIVNIVGTVIGGSSSAGVSNASTGTVTIVGDCIANSTNAVVNTTGNISASGSFFYAANGLIPISSPRIILGTTPLNARTRYALNGTGAYVEMFTADNNLGQAAPTDVRSGVSYASGNLTGLLTIPARGTVASGVNLGPSMPFTATRSGTTATATLAYSYPYQVGDVITVTGASNNEWNGDYTIASVISGTSVTFTVPNTHSATAGTGAAMQTKGTATLEASAVAAAVWGAATSSLTTAGSIGERLKNAATVATTGEQLATALTAP